MKKLMVFFCLLVCVLGILLPGSVQAQELPSLTTKVARLETYVIQHNWQDIRTYIHGPLGQIRQEVALILRQLPATQRQSVKETSQRFFNDLITLDFAARDQNPDRTDAAFSQLQTDLAQLLQSLP